MPSDGAQAELSDHREWPRGTTRAADDAATRSAIEALSGKVQNVESHLSEIKDLVEAVVDSLDALSPVTAEQLESHLGHHTERLSAETHRVASETSKVASETTRMANETSKVASETTRMANETGKVASQTDQLATDGARRHEEITGHLQTGFSADRTVPLQHQIAELKDDQRKLHDLVEAVADGLDAPATAPAAKLEQGDREALTDLSTRTTALEAKINDLAQLQRSVTETIAALRKEVTHLSTQSAESAKAAGKAAVAPAGGHSLDEASIDAIAHAVAKRIEQGPSAHAR